MHRIKKLFPASMMKEVGTIWNNWNNDERSRNNLERLEQLDCLLPFFFLFINTLTGNLSLFLSLLFDGHLQAQYSFHCRDIFRMFIRILLGLQLQMTVCVLLLLLPFFSFYTLRLFAIAQIFKLAVFRK
jgi:hypothetical protein